VEHQYRGVMVQGTCDPEALTLSPAEPDPPLPDNGVEPRRQPNDELRRLCEFGGPEDRVVIDLPGRESEGDVFCNGCVRKEHLLRYVPDLTLPGTYGLIREGHP